MCHSCLFQWSVECEGVGGGKVVGVARLLTTEEKREDGKEKTTWERLEYHVTPCFSSTLYFMHAMHKRFLTLVQGICITKWNLSLTQSYKTSSWGEVCTHLYTMKYSHL